MESVTPDLGPVRFRVLGPLEIRIGERLAPLPSAGERALLVLLLLSAGQTVPATTLVDQLWSEGNLPAYPLNALQIRVSKLRKAMTSLGIDLIRRESIGYRLVVDPSAVDAVEFAALLKQARALGAAAGSDPTTATLLAYDDALALWRGEPLSDFASEIWATTEAARLTELRWAAMTERAHVALALGRHEEIIADLEALALQDPARESIAAVLMLALFRAGRQADALAVFARARTFLDENLGLEPSASLRSLHEQVLRQDDSLGAPKEAFMRAVAPLGTRQDSRVETSGARATNLPTVLQPLFGREEDIASVRELVRAGHLVSLVGSGGAGKTSLARAAGVEERVRFSDGAVEVRLAAVREPEQVAVSVADAVGMSIDGAAVEADVTERLCRFLAGREMLLLLDNCEHVVDAVAVLVDQLLGRCPELTVLATSREALGVVGEVQFPVGPLAVPPEDTPADEVASYPAAQLFLERAGAVRSGLRLDDDELDAVARICRALDGIPLAVELAAARVSSLSVLEIAERLTDRFTLLTSGSRTAEARQRTLRATVDWSYTLLGETERTVFNRLSVFHGGFGLADAEAVIVDEEITTAEVVHVVGRLVERSLLQVDVGRTSRYGMLETLREYAAERLDADGHRKSLERRHATHYGTLVETSEIQLRGTRQREALGRLRQEHANIRAALSHLSGPLGDRDAALRMAGSLGLFWHQGRHLEGREVLADLLSQPDGSPDARARALQAVSLVQRPRACLVHPSPRCAEAAAESLGLYESLGDDSRAALSRVLLAVEGVTGVDSSLTEQLSMAEDQFKREGDDWGLAVIGFVRMEAALKRGDEAEAVLIGQTAAGTFRQLDDLWGLSAVLYHLGWGLRQFGSHSDGSRVLAEAIDVASSAGLDNTVQWAWADLGIAYVNLDDLDRARDAFDRARAVSENVGDGAGAALSDYGHGLIAEIEGNWAEARCRHERALTAFESLETPVARGSAMAGLARCFECAGDVVEATRRYREVEAVGRAAGEPGLVAAAHEGLGRLTDGDAGAALLAEAAEIRRRSVRPAPSFERVEQAAGSA